MERGKERESEIIYMMLYLERCPKDLYDDFGALSADPLSSVYGGITNDCLNFRRLWYYPLSQPKESKKKGRPHCKSVFQMAFLFSFVFADAVALFMEA